MLHTARYGNGNEKIMIINPLKLGVPYFPTNPFDRYLCSQNSCKHIVIAGPLYIYNQINPNSLIPKARFLEDISI
jgi:hypothetical protein